MGLEYDLSKSVTEIIRENFKRIMENRADSTSLSRRAESFRKEAMMLGEALCITATYLGISVLAYHGCAGQYPWEEKHDPVKTQGNYEPAVNIWEIPLQ